MSPPQEADQARFRRGVQALALEGAWASAVGALSSGVVVVGYALALGANATMVGLLAALPFFAQLAQLPAVALVEHLRRRKAIAVISITASRVVILLLAVAPFVQTRREALWTLVCGQTLIAVLVAVGSCAWNSWIHDFLRGADLGRVFSWRLRLSTAFGLVASLLVGALLDALPEQRRLLVFPLLFFLGAGAGFVGSAHLAQVPKAPMGADSEQGLRSRALLEPLRDQNFRRLIILAPPGISPTIWRRRSLRFI